MKKIILLACLLSTFVMAWAPQCSFVVKSSLFHLRLDKTLTYGSVGNLVLINCRQVSDDLPNAKWLKYLCIRYGVMSAATFVEADNSASECVDLAAQHELLYDNDGRYYQSRFATPSTFSALRPTVMHFPLGFIKMPS